MRIVIFGNSGSGKSTLAHRYVERFDLPRLELDDIVWEPGQIAVLRSQPAIDADLHTFVAANDRWVIEGCYGELVRAVLPRCTEAIFLNPGVDACVANNRRRPWEPHKYATPEAQDSMLGPLLDWVAAYYTRDDQWSLAFHRRIFDEFTGPKTEITGAAPMP